MLLCSVLLRRGCGGEKRTPRWPEANRPSSFLRPTSFHPQRVGDTGLRLRFQATVNHATMCSRVVAWIAGIAQPHLSEQVRIREASRLLHPTYVCTFVSSGVNETALTLLCCCASSLARWLILPRHPRSTRRQPVIRAECLGCRVHVTRWGHQCLRKLCHPRHPARFCLA